VRKYLLSAVKTLREGGEPPHTIRDPERNWFPHVDCFAELLPSDIHWRQRFDYLSSAATKANPAAFVPKRKAVS
jgi:hypothetical protein